MDRKLMIANVALFIAAVIGCMIKPAFLPWAGGALVAFLACWGLIALWRETCWVIAERVCILLHDAGMVTVLAIDSATDKATVVIAQATTAVQAGAETIKDVAEDVIKVAEDAAGKVKDITKARRGRKAA